MLLTLVFGDDYAAAAKPLVILTAGVFAIAISGILGTVLVAGRSLRPLAAQVALSLAVNLLCLALLVPRLGAAGAALATIACELVGLCVLGFVARRSLPGLIRVGVPIVARRPTFGS
jgi:O-antigen/teichoic acid export membrane protein